MVKERLSKLQKSILAVLGAMDSNDWESFYKEKQPKNKPPYWHRLRIEYEGGSIVEHGVKYCVEEVLQRKAGIEDIFEAMKKAKTEEGYMGKYFEKGKYFNTPQDEERKGRYDMPCLYGASPFSVSFSRSVRGLIAKGFLGVKYVESGLWGRQKTHIDSIRLNVNNQNIDINNNNHE